jgi:hypothetical protein
MKAQEKPYIVVTHAHRDRIVAKLGDLGGVTEENIRSESYRRGDIGFVIAKDKDVERYLHMLEAFKDRSSYHVRTVLEQPPQVLAVMHGAFQPHHFVALSEVVEGGHFIVPFWEGEYAAVGAENIEDVMHNIVGVYHGVGIPYSHSDRLLAMMAQKLHDTHPRTDQHIREIPLEASVRELSVKQLPALFAGLKIKGIGTVQV